MSFLDIKLSINTCLFFQNFLFMIAYMWISHTQMESCYIFLQLDFCNQILKFRILLCQLILFIPVFSLVPSKAVCAYIKYL